MEKLNFEQMENVKGGLPSGCGWSIAAEVFECMTACFIGGPLGLALWMGGQVFTLGGVVTSCKG